MKGTSHIAVIGAGFLAGLLIFVGLRTFVGAAQLPESVVEPSVPAAINYQGVLTDSSGELLDGEYTMRFALYAGAGTPTSLWTETQTVTVDDGLFNVYLGDVTPLPESLFTGQPLYLGVKVGDDDEMEPRLRIAALPYAFMAHQTSCNLTAWFRDADGDSYGDASDAQTACEQPVGYVLDNSDCDDTDENVNPGEQEACNETDDDCNPATSDGSGETWLGAVCDGADADLCMEGTYSCSAGAQTCSDVTGSNVEVCNEADDDCNPATSDGSDETWLGAVCDGADAGLCLEGTYSCSAGAQSCSDMTGDDVDLCNGADDDCDPATSDGSGETWLGAVCDGADADLCLEGTYSCSAGAQTCSDVTGSTVEVCNEADDDCNPATVDGSSEGWFGVACDGGDADLCEEGTYTCTAGSQACGDATGNNLEACNGLDDDCNPATLDGSGESWIGNACDGTDAGLCPEGTYSCSAGSQSCSDMTGDDIDLCNGADEDCDPATVDGAGEGWFGVACDGGDTDLCEEGAYTCQSSVQVCSDATGNDLELCNGVDDDCNPSTDDGWDESWIGDLCDGGDADLCQEGVYYCSAGSQACSDATGDDVEICNSLDDDCDGQTDEGDLCDGGTCSGGVCTP